MIDYRKAGKECREAYFEYRDAPIVGASEASATSFVAGWNAAIASISQKLHEEPAEHPAGPMPDPGEGYRLLSKNPPEDLSPGDDFWSPSYGGWHKSTCATSGITSQSDVLWFRRKIEPAEHPAGPMPDPGEGYRILSKDEDLRKGDELLHPRLGVWLQSSHASLGYKRQDAECWYRRKDEYRKPVLPGDARKACEFSDDGERWLGGYLDGWLFDRKWVSSGNDGWKHCRIKAD